MYQNIFDTHSHYDDEKFNPDREALLNSLSGRGVSLIVSCGCDYETTKFNSELSEKYDFLYFAAGFHPECLENIGIDCLDEIEKFAAMRKCVAIGEIGLDYHWMSSSKEKQKEFFTAQTELAKKLDMPVIVHDREAHGDTLEILKKLKPKGVVHCFSGSREMAKEIIKLGMYIGINGVVTFQNARKSLEVVRDIPLDRLLLETDCPYLAPVPHRGKRNDSSLIPHIAEKISDILDIEPQEIIDAACENGKRLFSLT